MTNKKKYRVTLSYDATESVQVVAENEAEALDMVYDKARAYLCHECAGRLDLGDINGALVSDEDGNTLLSEGALLEVAEK